MSLYMDRQVRRALIARVAADTGVDGYGAAAMVDDVRDRGVESPHADVVATAAHAIFAPVIDSFGKAAELMRASFERMVRALEPAIKALAEHPLSAGMWQRSP